MPVSSSTEHWIKPDALTINLNHFGDPDYLQVSVLAGAVVMAFKQDVIGYNAAHNYRTWPLDAANTYLETTSAVNVYAKLTRSEVNAQALVIYDTVLRDIEGREITYAEDGSEVLGEANPEYFFVILGQISASVNSGGGSVQREWTKAFTTGTLYTNQQQNNTTGLLDLMFRPHYDNPLDPNEVTWIEALSHLGVNGGVTMFIDNGTMSLPQLYEGLPIDTSTLRWIETTDSDGTVTRLLGINPDIELGGGAATWDELKGKPSWIGNTKPSYNYSEILQTPDLSVYALASDLSVYALASDLAKYVTLGGDETITGLKNFTKGIQIDGLWITKSQDDVIYLDANLVVRGGITMYAEGTVDVGTIFDALPIDGSTIYWDGKVLKANITEGAITNITSAMVVEALGYTPYNASNPKGYISGITSDMVTTALGYTPLEDHQTIYALTIQKNGTTVGTYTPNSAKKTIDIVVPTKVSELTNDSEYATTSDLDTRISDLINGAPAAYDTLKEIADVLEGNINSIGDIITTLGTKADKATKISAGTGLSGGGTLEADRTLSLATSGVTADTYKSVTVDKYGRVTSGTNPTTLAGYGITDAYTKTDVDDLLKLYVTLAGAQTITGEKNFTGGLKVNGSPIVYDSTNKYWKLEGDLLVTGGVTMYGSDSEFTPSTIMDGVVVDNVTIKKNADGALYFAGSIDGGIASSVDWANVENKPSFATVATSGKYSDLSGVPTLLSSFTNDVGFITSYVDTKNTAGSTNTSSKIYLIGATSQAANPQTYSHDTAYVGTDGYLYSGGAKVLTSHQTIYSLTMQAGAFSAVTFDPNGANKTVNIPTTTSHISEGGNLYYTDARAQAAITGGASTIVTSNLTASRALISNASGKVAVSAVTSTELGYLDGVTSAIQTQLDSKLASASYTASDVLSKLLTVDGASSGLDADLLDGTHKSGLLTGASSTSATNLSITVGGTTKTITDLYAYKTTQLETARTIWGQSFDGTANISGALSDVTNINSIINLTSAGNVLIGTTTDSGYKLDVVGDIRSTTNVRTPIATIDGIPIYKSQDDVLYIDGNLAVRGGITMYATDAIDVDDVIANLPIASTSAQGIASFNPSDFSVVDGYVSFIGTAGSVDESVLAAYAKKTDLSSYLPLSGGQVTGRIEYNLDVDTSGTAVSVPAAGSIYYDTSMTADGSINTKKTFIGSAKNQTSNVWNHIISVRHVNGAASDSTLYGMYLSCALASDDNLVWNRQILGIWQGERVILDSVNWSQYITAADGGNYLPLSGGVITNSKTGLYINRTSAGTAHITFQVEGSAVGDLGVNSAGSPAFYSYGLSGISAGWKTLMYSGGSGYSLSDVTINNSKTGLYINRTSAGTAHITFQVEGSAVGDLGVNSAGSPAFYSYGLSGISAGWKTLMYSGGSGYSLSDVTIYQDEWADGIILKRQAANSGAGISSYTYDTLLGTFGVNGSKYFEFSNNLNSEVFSISPNGDGLFYGGITMYSDIRKKTKLQDVELSLKQIADAPLIEHYYNSDSNKTTHVGSIAQYWAETIGNDWFCKLDGDGYYTMEVQNAALASAISVARHLQKYESKTDKKIRMLKKRISELEDKIEELEHKST